MKPKKISLSPKLVRTVVEVVVLSKEPIGLNKNETIGPDTLDRIRREIDYGACVGLGTVKSVQTVAGDKLVKSLQEVGNDGSFFGLDEHGNLQNDE